MANVVEAAAAAEAVAVAAAEEEEEVGIHNIILLEAATRLLPIISSQVHLYSSYLYEAVRMKTTIEKNSDVKITAFLYHNFVM